LFPHISLLLPPNPTSRHRLPRGAPPTPTAVPNTTTVDATFVEKVDSIFEKNVDNNCEKCWVNILKKYIFLKMLGQYSLKNQYFSKNVEKCLFEKSWSNI
jgi:hypothetical protein